MRSLVILLLVTAFLACCALAQNEAAVLFNARCARCHGQDGAGKTAAAQKMSIPDLRSAAVQKRSDQEMFETVANGKNHHDYPHVFRSLGLSDPQIRQLVGHVRELGKARVSRSKSGNDKGGPSSH